MTFFRDILEGTYERTESEKINHRCDLNSSFLFQVYFPVISQLFYQQTVKKMKTFAFIVLSALAQSVNGFATPPAFQSSRSGSSLSMAMERTYIMVRKSLNCSVNETHIHVIILKMIFSCQNTLNETPNFTYYLCNFNH